MLEKGERAIDEVIDVMGRATVEAVLQMSAEQVDQMRALLLEHGIVVPLDRSLFERRLPAVFTDAEPTPAEDQALDACQALKAGWFSHDSCREYVTRNGKCVRRCRRRLCLPRALTTY